MPIPALGEITGADIQELLDSLEKQRKELEWLLQSLDSNNVKELNADVINAGVINAEHISIGSETTFQTGYNPDDIRMEVETQFTVFDGEIKARVKQTDFNLLGNRVATAESTLSVLPGQISSKVSYTDYTGTNLVSMINQTPSNITLSASKITLAGAVSVLSDISGNLGTITSGNINISTDVYVGRNIYMGASVGNVNRAIKFGYPASYASIDYIATDGRMELTGDGLSLFSRFGNLKVNTPYTIELNGGVQFNGSVSGLNTTAILG